MPGTTSQALPRVQFARTLHPKSVKQKHSYEAKAQLSPPTPRDQTVREHHPNQNGSSDGEDQPKCRPGFQAEALKVVKVGLSA
jgi:hypothetical protein